MLYIARVAVAAATYSIDLPYSYRVPEELRACVQPGMRVLVPFGQGNRTSEGLVLSLEEGEPAQKLKPIQTLLDEVPVLNREGIQLALWMRERFFCTVYAGAMTMLPTGLWYVLKESYVLAPGLHREVLEQELDTPKVRKILDLIYALGGRADLEQIKNLPDIKNPKQTLRVLVKAKVLLRETTARRNIGDKKEKLAVLAMPPQEAMALVTPRKQTSSVRYAVTELLCALGSADLKELRYFTGASLSVIKGLEKSGILTLQERETFRYTLPVMGEPQPLFPLNEEQEAARLGLSALRQRGEPQAALLYGVTGSGKTQVYLHLIQEVLDEGKGAIVMVPEIALTPNLIRIFSAHFGQKVAVLHSYLSTGERYDEWKRIRAGQAPVVIGTRSAVFAPLQSIGLIVLDEEQEGSYQSESMVRYHAREVAKFRCMHHKGLLLLGSATPAVESRYAAEIGQYHLFTLRKRYNAHPLPQVYLADMKEQLRCGNATGLSQTLRTQLEKNLARGEQTILFLNRRGNSRMAICSECGEVPACPRCSVHLTYHSANGRLMCHYCGHSEPLPAVCPKCYGRLRFVGLGTQKLQEELQTLYPEVEVMRMDTDTISASQSHEVMLERFRKKRIPILLGTQMVAKGLDFENVTLVGVIDADLSLYADSYRAVERTFSLLTQVVGRAGRGEKPGRAVIQTWTPDHDIIHLAAEQAYDAFYETERDLRKALRFPPFVDLLRLTVSGTEESQVLRVCAVLRRSLEPWTIAQRRAGLETEILGPAPAGILKINNRYRYRILLKCQNQKETRAMLAELIRTAQKDQINKGISILVDVNPMD